MGIISQQTHNVEAALNLLKHRGPDDSGHIQCRHGDNHVILAHTRLSILDLSKRGHQPMTTNDGGYHIVYNGEVYNYRELARANDLDQELSSGTDTEVVLNLFRRFGVSCLTWLHGDFAFAVYDVERAKLVVVRDRLGVKPMYYSLTEEGLVFGSELKVFASLGVELSENRDELASYFVFKYFPQDSTPYSEVKRLSPGTYLEYDLVSGKAEFHQYWTPDYSTSAGMSYADAVDLLRSYLCKAVQERLIADVPVGTFLSGGLDSSAIAYYLKDRDDVHHHCARKSQTDLKKEGTSSDAFYAERLSQDWGLDTHYYDIGFDTADEELIKKTVYYGDDLIADGSQIPSYLITENAAEVSKVLLSGMGADELFLGYGGHLLTLLSGHMDRLPESLRKRLSVRLNALQPGKGRGKGYKRFLVKMGRYDAYGDTKYGLYSIVGDYERSCSVFKHSKDPLQSISPYFENAENPFEALTRFERENFLVKNLHYLDRMCMANSVEGRVPFMDHRLVEFALSLPVEYRLSRFGNSKRILKDAMKGLVPDYILNRRKAGFGMPLRSVFSDRRKLDALIKIDYFGGIDGFDPDAILALADEHIAGINDNSSILYALVSYRVWRQLWVEN